DLGFHVGTSSVDPEVVQIRFFEQPGIQLTPSMQKEIEKHFTRQEFRRVAYDEVGSVTYPARVRESYAQDLLSSLDVEAIRERGEEIPVEQTLLLFLRLIGSNGRRGKLAFPVTVTSQVEELVRGSDLEVERTPASLADLTRAAAEQDVIFAGAVGGGYVFPEF